ncbi:MAG: hypothetical protein A2133_12130 [Actinobacteria bacterium RBG_16_64_13]|nr:MAG: hypothetical protein A2133_12130 [Actinobacteria bacterium RBG_16_64_13]
MQIIVQEGEVLVSLVSPIQAPDESLRTTTIHSVSGAAKVYYRDHELIRVEARDGNLEILPGSIGALTWVKKDRRYQLKVGND